MNGFKNADKEEGEAALPSDLNFSTCIVFPEQYETSSYFLNDGDNIEKHLTQLKIGVLMSFYKQEEGKYEDKLLCINAIDFKLSWYAFEDTLHNNEQGCIDIENIREIKSRTSRKCLVSDVSNIGMPGFSLRIVYGNKFNLNVLYWFTYEQVMMETVVKALRYFKYKDRTITRIDLIQIWLHREWSYLKKNNIGKISLIQFRTFLSSANIKIQNKKIYDIFESVSCQKDTIDFEQFSQAYNKIIYHQELTKKYCCLVRRAANDDEENNDGHFFDINDENNKLISDIAFQKFLLKEQNDESARDLNYVHDTMKSLQSSSERDTTSIKPPMTITIDDFLNFLFHIKNSICKSGHSEVYQDMSKPLSQYWIASSHNTFTSGGQLQNSCSLEVYARVLRQGCRCIEVVCWDGPNSEPLVHHGLVLSNALRLADVLQIIADNAFLRSKYPLIISLQNHCSINQQITMATLFKNYLGKYLVTNFLKVRETKLPSPESLKYKIIINHRLFRPEEKDEIKAKLKGKEERKVEDKCSAIYDPIFLQSHKPGVMYKPSKSRQEWNKYYVRFSDNMIRLTTISDEKNATEKNKRFELTTTETNKENDTVNKKVLHLTQPWYHGNIDRARAERLLVDYNRGNGSFLVRPCSSFENGYSLTFWWKGHVKHIHIKQKSHPDEGSTRYFVVKQSFDSLYCFIENYRYNPLKTDKLQLTLREPIGMPESHLDAEWFHEYLSENEAEDALANISIVGYFLVRKRIPNYSYEPESYILSFNCDNEQVNHYRIVKNQNIYCLDETNEFETLVGLVTYYKKHPVNKSTRLIYPCTRHYLTNQPIQNRVRKKVACRVKYAYNPPSSRTEYELILKRGDVVTNVTRYHGQWWVGDVSGQTRKWFPVHFTEVMGIQEDDLENEYTTLPNLNGPPIKRSECEENNEIVIRLDECTPKFISSTFLDRPFLFKWGDDNPSQISYTFEQQEMCLDTGVVKANKNACFTSHPNLIAKELHDLLAYCKSRPSTEMTSHKNTRYNEMTSFSELQIEKLVYKSQYDKKLLKYHEHQLSRVFPKINRFDSSNYNPIPYWNFGTQICAMNYQTPDQYMQIARGMFADNGGCGYILQPRVLRDNKFNPYSNNTLPNVEPLNISLSIIAARHLPKQDGGCFITCPYIEIQVLGLECDFQTYKTPRVLENGLSPIWYRETYNFDVLCPPLAKIHFLVKHENNFGEGIVIAQTCFPLMSLRQGHRSVPLTNIYNDDIPLASILVELRMGNAVDAQDKRMQDLPERQLTDLEYHARLLLQEEDERHLATRLSVRRNNNGGGR